MPQASEPVDLRPLVTTRCPECHEVSEDRAGSIGRCACGQMLAFMSATRKRKAPPPYKESERVRRFREKAAEVTAYLKQIEQ